MSTFAALTLVGWCSVVLVAGLLRTRQFAAFVGVFLGVYSLVACGVSPGIPRVVMPVALVLHATVYVNFLALTRPQMRALPYRLLISWPASFFSAGTLFALPWAVLLTAGLNPWGLWVPYALAAIGLVQSLTSRKQTIDLALAEVVTKAPDAVAACARGTHRQERPLRIVQISDPHLGPFMSVARLRRIAQRAVESNADLVFLTGDFLTMESHSDPELLLRALAPLAAMPGKVFACFGNHDHEAPAHVKRALYTNGIALLIDAAAEVDTAAGPVQIVGADFVWRDRAEHLQRLCDQHPRKPGMTRILMLHDPGAFKHLPSGEADLVLAGHTHGGQIGLLSVGLQWTFLRLFGTKLPDHGFWSRGSDRMYVHRGTGHYGFPLRLGVPAEESLLRVHRHAS